MYLLESLLAKVREDYTRAHHLVLKTSHYVGIYPKNMYVLLKYLGGLHSDLRRQVMLFKPRIVGELCVEE
jgi:hypothetical protein